MAKVSFKLFKSKTQVIEFYAYHFCSFGTYRCHSVGVWNAISIFVSGYVHTMPAHFMDIFFLAEFQKGRIQKRTSSRHILITVSCEHSKVMKTENF